MNTLQILGYIGLGISILIGGFLLIRIIMLMCQKPPEELRARRKRKPTTGNNNLIPDRTKDSNCVETASLYSEEFEMRRQKFDMKPQSKGDSDGEMTTFPGSSNLSKKSLRTHSNSDSGISNQASRSGVSTIWCEIYPASGGQKHPITRSSSSSSSPHHHPDDHHHQKKEDDEEQFLDESTVPLSPYSHNNEPTTSSSRPSQSSYTISPQSLLMDSPHQLEDYSNSTTINIFEGNHQSTHNSNALEEITNNEPLNNVIISQENEIPLIGTASSVLPTTSATGQTIPRIDYSIIQDVNAKLIIVTMATKTKIVGYCVNMVKQKCYFYSYNMELLPMHVIFKVFRNTTSDPEDGYYSVQNLKFALLLWRNKIKKYQYYRLYTDHPAVSDLNCFSVKQLRVYIDHLQICEGNSALLNYDNFLIRPQQEEALHGYRRYIQPALYLQSDQVETFEFAIKYQFGILRERVVGTHFVPRGVGTSMFDSSTTYKFDSYFNKIQLSLEQWDYRSCQCSEQPSEQEEHVPTYIS